MRAGRRSALVRGGPPERPWPQLGLTLWPNMSEPCLVLAGVAGRSPTGEWETVAAIGMRGSARRALGEAGRGRLPIESL